MRRDEPDDVGVPAWPRRHAMADAKIRRQYNPAREEHSNTRLVPRGLPAGWRNWRGKIRQRAIKKGRSFNSWHLKTK
jgi:hypothetical protein